jgi:hypothetical protein
MEVFRLQAQVLGITHSVVASADGMGITVTTDATQQAARTVLEAQRVARNFLGPVLHDADKRKLPWGLYVSVSGVAAVYGSWPLLPSSGERQSSDAELVTRIRRAYKDGSALAALENALRIINAYTNERRAA